MASTSVDGLISGLGTSDVINQLMQLERQPQMRLVAKTAAIGSMSAAYKGHHTRFDAILQAATSLGMNTDCQARKAHNGESTRLPASAPSTALPGQQPGRASRRGTADE